MDSPYDMDSTEAPRAPPRIYRAGTDIRRKLDTLKDTIVRRPPFLSGSLKVDPDELVLFYGKPGEDGKPVAGRIEFSNPSEAELKSLTSVCELATFGKDQQDVLDLTYRSALKLDTKFFAPKLDLYRTGLIDLVRTSLLEGGEASRQVIAELYKLNVYGKGSFFKSHKDTPRDESMFGSLVVVLPSAHEGGELILRHEGREWTFDSASAIKNTTSSSVGYVAFFSDIEHEVKMVTSGYRVTLTYNLYFAEPGRSYAAAKHDKAIPAVAPAITSSFQSTLTTLLEDTTFLPDGGFLGFGMRHEYPINTATKFGDNRDYYDMRPDAPQDSGKDTLIRLSGMLKGDDAAVAESCRALGLSVSLNVVHTHEHFISVMFDGVPELEGFGTENDDLIARWLRDKHNPRVIMTSVNKWVNVQDSERVRAVREEFAKGRAKNISAGADNNTEYRTGEYSTKKETKAEQKAIESALQELDEDEIDMNDLLDPDDPKLDIVVHWVTPSTPFTAFKSTYVAYGNESGTGYLYGRVCLLVEVGPPDNRVGKAKLVMESAGP